MQLLLYYHYYLFILIIVIIFILLHHIIYISFNWNCMIEMETNKINEKIKMKYIPFQIELTIEDSNEFSLLDESRHKYVCVCDRESKTVNYTIIPRALGEVKITGKITVSHTIL